MHITVVYDNHACRQDMEMGWGFSCLISGAEKMILFDTGPGSSLLGNMEQLAIAPAGIDAVVLSHIHPDHSGGLESFLEKNPDVTVYLPESFPGKFKDEVRAQGAQVFDVKQPTDICENVWSTGQLGKRIKEQALIIRSELGLVLITGCAHPGIVKMINAAKDIVNNDMLLVMGGFHLEWAIGRKIEKIMSSFRQSGVRYAGPCHCTGEKARRAFEEQFGRNYLNIGAGKIIKLADLH